MKKYDNIIAETLLYDPDGDFLKAKEEKLSNVIVLTLEELRELCNYMVKEWIDGIESGDPIEEEIAGDLDKYLTSTGIQLNTQ